MVIEYVLCKPASVNITRYRLDRFFRPALPRTSSSRGVLLDPQPSAPSGPARIWKLGLCMSLETRCLY
ncbi:Uncharacterized protein HZ326_4349 [Fusarium oxysporum f. sp. albedinis]|nr:Uncharacterized protein HZ326_4349 [Fusarium oxysporum f. sp. albedinis]